MAGSEEVRCVTGTAPSPVLEDTSFRIIISP